MAPIIVFVATVVGRLIPFLVVPAVTAAADRVTDLVGRLWPVLLATIAVRNGRYVFLFALLCEWLAGIQTRTWVFTTGITLSQVAHPIVFADLALPYAEAYYYMFHQPAYVASYLFFCFYFHYPAWTHGILYMLCTKGPGWLWSHATLSACFDLLWRVPWYAGISYQAFIRMRTLERCLRDGVLWPAWRAVGKGIYDHKLRFHNWRSGSFMPYFEPDSSRPFYAHQPLTSKSHIRLLRILPRGTSEVVRCSMLHVDLDDGSLPVFEAISYTWNGSERSHVVYIDGYPFRTTKNAHDLLFDLSPVSNPRPVWIDSICINQDDIVEKSWHVRTMARIYRRAARVAVWLGTAPDADLAVGLILELNHKIKYGAFNDRQFYSYYLPQRGSPRWLALGRLLEHTYFTRVWMVQETSAQLDVHVMYGGHLMLWETIRRVFINIFLSHELITLVEDATAMIGPGHQRMMRAGLLNGQQMIFIDGIRDKVLTRDPDTPLPPLRWLLMRCWSLQATDPRDKVFALWNMAEEPDHPWITPDYTKTALEVYTDAACYIACQGAESALYILPCAGIGWNRTVPNLASWVPDWSTVGRSLLTVTPPRVAAYMAAGDLSADDAKISVVGVVDRQGITAAAGLQLDAILLPCTITDLSTEFPRTVFDPSNPSPIRDSDVTQLTGTWLRDVHACVTRWLAQGQEGGNRWCPHTGQSSEEVIWRALLADAATLADIGDSTMNLDLKTGRPAAPRYATHYRLAMREFCDMCIATTAEERSQDEAELRRHALEIGVEQWDEDDGHDNAAKRHVMLNLISRWATTMQLRCVSRRMACTADGRVCLVPPGTEPGDRIGVVPGLGMPVVLRPRSRVAESSWVRRNPDDVDDGTSACFYQLVGECYAHGMMDGEMADLSKGGTIVLV